MITHVIDWNEFKLIQKSLLKSSIKNLEIAAALIKRLQEYQRFKTVSEKIAVLPMVDRDIFIASAQKPKNKEEKKPDINLTSSELFETIK